MSKVYILYKEDIFSIEENVNVVAVFSSYASMLLWLKEQWGFESDVEDQDELGAYFSKHYTEDEVDYFMCYRVHDLIGETSHKTDKLVINGRWSAMLSLRQRVYAIFKSLYFGILPSWFYEKHCHYSDNGEGMNIKTYLQHLWLNLIIVKCLVLKTEHECTHDFHKMRVNKWFRWQYKD